MTDAKTAYLCMRIRDAETAQEIGMLRGDMPSDDITRALLDALAEALEATIPDPRCGICGEWL